MIEQPTHSDLMQSFTHFLESKKLRKTPERFAILEKVWKMRVHFDVEELYLALEADAYHVSRATVYNTIDLLCECGILRKHQFSSHQAQYELAGGNHFHLICTQCGKIKEVKNEEFINPFMRLKYAAFTPSYFSAYLYGLCSVCVRHNKKIKKNNEK